VEPVTMPFRQAIGSFTIVVLAFATLVAAFVRPDVIRYGVTHGEGRSRFTMNIRADGLQLLSTQSAPGRDDRVRIRFEPIGADGYDSLTSGLNPLLMLVTPGTNGCPGCSDGGAEWVEATLPLIGAQRIEFEFGDPPVLLADAVARLRKRAGY
jgi:hypothetical protein